MKKDQIAKKSLLPKADFDIDPLHEPTKLLAIPTGWILGGYMSVDELLERCRMGDREAENELVATYLTRIARFAEQRISAKFKARVDGDDIAQSVLKSAALRFRSGQLEAEDERTFWGLLVSITINKVNRRIQFEKRLKRRVDLEVSPDGSLFSWEHLQIMCRESTVEDQAEFIELLERVFDRIKTLEAKNPPSHEEVLLARLNGDDYADISQRFGTSTKTIKRRLDDIELLLKTEFGVEE